jgi:tetratricopeptide (TPR) repeat protein
MDLLDFEQTDLYFDEPLKPEVARLLQEAGELYGSEEAEAKLLLANFLAPQQLTVLVALYRYYYYQHRLEDALLVAESTLAVAGRRLGFPCSWMFLHLGNLSAGVLRSMGLVRFYLMALKAAGLVNLRLGNRAEGQAMLEKLLELDSHDRIGGRALLELAQAAGFEERSMQ